MTACFPTGWPNAAKQVSVYDFNRKDAQGNYRELHTDLAFDAINFSAPTPKKCGYSTQENERNTLLNTPYFKTLVD